VVLSSAVSEVASKTVGLDDCAVISWGTHDGGAISIGRTDKSSAGASSYGGKNNEELKKIDNSNIRLFNSKLFFKYKN
jgi:hypothetical protein